MSTIKANYMITSVGTYNQNHTKTNVTLIATYIISFYFVRVGTS